MWLKTFLVILVLISVEANNVCDINSKVLKAGYPFEKYDLVTEDGYILEVYRIPHGKNETQGHRPVVFMMHGLLSSASSFVELGPDYAMAFNLADAGFDIWLGNARGVCNSRRHITLDPENDRQKAEFFNFSWEEIALYDLPLLFDFALKTSGQEKLHYIGHSQGGAIFLVLNSMRPEYNEKIESAHLIAGVGYKRNFPNHRLSRFASYTNVLYDFVRTLGLHEIKHEWIASDNDKPAEVGEYRVSLRDLGTSASLKQLSHFGQNIRDKTFRRWDYSLLENFFHYGSLTPPEYNLRRVNVDITMHYTIADTLLDERDVLAMVNDLPNAKARKVPKDNFSHYDFVQSSFVKPLVTDYIISDLKSR
ncbi:lipase 3 [Pieris rapae]|uniref:lipase 3 n=1 Tax=Pieris rapae TaxID=64459 RepID=UPI001E27D5DF|nr:lipase 3 [Pieris rapae]